MNYDLFCLGGSAVDLLLQVPRLPLLDEKLETAFAGRLAGGLVANTACAAARLGLQVGWSGYLGNDDFAQVVLEDFARFGVDSRYAVKVEGANSDFTVILLTPRGERTILIVSNFAEPPLTAEVLNVLSFSRLGYALPRAPKWFERFSRAVRSGGGQVVVDVEGSCPVRGADLDAALCNSDVAFFSRDGLRLATGADSLENGVQRLLKTGLRVVVVTLGESGALVATEHEVYQHPAFRVPVVDTTGAGDCFHAAFLVGWLEGWELRRCLRFASAAAALSVQALGARGGLPDRAAVERFLAQQVEKPDVG